MTNVVLTIAGLMMYISIFALIYEFEYPPAAGGFNSSFDPRNLSTLHIFGAGLDIVPLALAMIAVAMIASIAVSRTGVKPLAILGSALAAAGFYLLSTASTLTQTLLYETVVGAGLALLNATVINLLVLTVDPKDMGQATAMNGVFRNIGASVGAPIAGSLIATFVLTSGPFAPLGLPTHLAFQYAFWIAAIAALAGAALVVFGQEVLGTHRHEKFAHLPTLPRGSRRFGRVREPVPPTDPLTGEAVRIDNPR